MIKANKRKAALVALLLMTALLVSSCYMSPSDITDTSSNMNVGSDTLPFATVGATATIAPTPTPTPNTAGGVGQNQPNWGTVFTDPPTTPPNQNQNHNQNENQNATTAPLPTTPPRTPTPKPQQDDSVLKTGSSGDAVKQLQDRLKDLKYYSGPVDGDYGNATAYAVEAFQKANGLYADGIAGQKTQEAMYSYYAIPKSENSNSNNNSNSNTSTPRRTSTPKPTATPNLSKARFLKVGMSGSDVRQVQSRLISLGYLGGSADGNFGGSTEAAVKAFQKKSKIWDDGIAGPDTQTQLYASNAAKASGIVASVGLSLKEGMKGSDEVRALQKRLIALGYLSGTADGDFGAGTKNAVIAFQQDNGLTADGVAGTGTQNKLFASDAASKNGSGVSGGTPTATPNISGPAGNAVYTTLKQGDSGEAVRKLQQRLKDLGYYTGTVDGEYGSGTVTAVQSFQTMNHLTVDGVAGPATQQRLYGDNSSANKVPGSLKQYDESSDVRDMQYALYELGYFQDSINGIYAQSTVDAIREFQMINTLTVDGVAGNATLNLLFSIFAKPVTSVTGEYETMMLGSEGDSVVVLQAALIDLGYLESSATGVFDDATFQALKSFQQYNGVTVDGIAGATTLEKLYSDNPVPNPLRN